MLRLLLLLSLFGPVVARAQKPSPSPAASAPSTSAPDPRALAARMQKFYESTKDLHARFSQAVDTGTGRKRAATGEVWLKKPGRMRWDYQKPEKKLMVADGSKLWVYEPDDQQAFETNLKASTLPSSVSFLWGAGKLDDEFDLSVDKEVAPPAPGDVVLKLVPKQATAQYRYLDFIVDGATAMVKQTIVYDQQGGTNRITFEGVETNKGASDDKFKFVPPAGTRIIRP